MSPGKIGAEFLDLSPEELLAKCREYRAEAETLAATTSIKMREAYVQLVTQWSLLADDIQNGIDRRGGLAGIGDELPSLPPTPSPFVAENA